MPHIVVEYSTNVEPAIRSSKLLPALHQAVQATNLFDPQAIKARSIGYADIVLPEGAVSFVHVTVSILSGRTMDQRSALNDAVFGALKSAMPQVDKLSSDIREMTAETYRK